MKLRKLKKAQFHKKMAALKGFKHPCQLCDLKISSQSNLKNHKMSVHVGVKYQCNQCDFKFTKQGNLKNIKFQYMGVNVNICGYFIEPANKSKAELFIVSRYWLAV